MLRRWLGNRATFHMTEKGRLGIYFSGFWPHLEDKSLCDQRCKFRKEIRLRATEAIQTVRRPLKTWSHTPEVSLFSTSQSGTGARKRWSMFFKSSKWTAEHLSFDSNQFCIAILIACSSWQELFQNTSNMPHSFCIAYIIPKTIGNRITDCAWGCARWRILAEKSADWKTQIS